VLKEKTFGKAQTQKACGNTDTILSEKAKHSEQERHEGMDTHCAKYMPHLEEKPLSRNDNFWLLYTEKKDGYENYKCFFTIEEEIPP